MIKYQIAISRFAIIIDMLKIAFTEPIDENDYHNMVECLRQYATNRDSSDIEREGISPKKR
jgi:hypothetical protein